jgi:hypothetical protein
MYNVSDQQVNFILSDLTEHGIRIESLRHNLLDHICILIEQNLEPGGDFEEYYHKAIKAFYTNELQEIEEETLFLLTAKNRLVLSRNQFFLVLFTLFIGPFIGYDVAWLATSGKAAGWLIPVEVWGPTMVFSLFPLLILVVLYLTPDWLDPLVPQRSTILLGFNPLIKVIPGDFDATELRSATT